MTLGLGIFLAALVLSPVVLFAITKDRWNWKKIGLWIGAITLATCAFLAALFWWSNRPKEETELWGIALGDSVADVKFKKGPPESEVFGFVWAYPFNSRGTYVYVEFYNSRVDRILAIPGDSDSPLSIQGVRFEEQLNDLNRVFGAPSATEESSDSMWRLVSFAKYNVAFLLHQNKILGISVFNGSRKIGLEIDDKLIQADSERHRVIKEKREAEKAAREQEQKRQQALKDAIAAREAAERAEAERLQSELRAKAEEERQAVIAQQRLRQQIAEETARAKFQQEHAKQEQLRKAELSKWARLQLGMTTVQVEQLLGRPQSISTFVDWATWWFPSIPGELTVLKITFKYGRVESFDGPNLNR